MGRRRTHTETWWAAAPSHVLRCTGHLKRDGSQCRSEASPGTSVCDLHGALVPAVQASAARRIQMSVDEAAKQLVAWMNDPAVDTRERVKIAHDLLDRGGLGATAKVLIGINPEDPVEALFRSIAADPNGLEPPRRVELEVLPAPTLRDIDPPEPEVIEAELVVEPPSPPAHTVHVSQSMSASPPKHLRDDLARHAALRELL